MSKLIEIKQRKVCGSCRAFKAGHNASCEFGYSITRFKVFDSGINAKPAEPCPKPLTVGEYYEASKYYKKHN